MKRACMASSLAVHRAKSGQNFAIGRVIYLFFCTPTGHGLSFSCPVHRSGFVRGKKYANLITNLIINPITVVVTSGSYETRKAHLLGNETRDEISVPNTNTSRKISDEPKGVRRRRRLCRPAWGLWELENPPICPAPIVIGFTFCPDYALGWALSNTTDNTLTTNSLSQHLRHILTYVYMCILLFSSIRLFMRRRDTCVWTYSRLYPWIEKDAPKTVFEHSRLASIAISPFVSFICETLCDCIFMCPCPMCPCVHVSNILNCRKK